MVFMPPRHGKSEIVSVQFPAWAIGKDNDRQIIEASYSGDLATDFGRQTRDLIGNKEFSNIFSDVSLSEDSQAKGKWNTNGRGAYNAVGVGGATTGKGADILIIDDPIKNRQDADSEVIRETAHSWYRSTARTRLSPTGAIILVMTRWHDDDLAGRILKSENADKWEVIRLPAIATQDEEFRKEGEALWGNHFTLDNLNETKSDLGGYEWSALYQQNPVDEESQEIKKEWFRYRKLEEIPETNRKFATIDTALSKHAKSDSTGVTRNYVDVDNNWNIISTRYRINSKSLVDLIFQLHGEGFEQIGIEEGAYIEAVKPFMDEEMSKRNKFPNVITLKHGGVMKETRIRGLVPRYETKKIFHIVGRCTDLEEEALRFPKAVHDDCLDSLAYQLHIAEPPHPESENIDFNLYGSKFK